MRPKNPYLNSKGKRALSWIYIFILAVMAVTGFGQMPIFKRYYIADIPGMAWTADFFFTHYLHYLGAIMLLGIFSYFIMDFILLGRKNFGLTKATYFRLFFLGGLIVTGIFRVLKNLPDVVFSPSFTLFIDVIHLALAVAFLFSALLFMIRKRTWLVVR